MLSLVSKKINVLIVGGGRAALIKAKTFVKRGCQVEVVSKEFLEEFKKLGGYNNLKLIYGEYNNNYIIDKHIIIIATNCETINEVIRNNCNELYKLYIDCTEPKNGLCITPCNRETKNILFGVHTAKGNPKISVFLADKVKQELDKYDGLAEFTSNIRNKIKNCKRKQEILSFICSEDFYFFYSMGKEKIVLQLFYLQNGENWDGD
jgi:precorrin-2 dehydrogenase/sirohydrochlorin ferrochelatase